MIRRMIEEIRRKEPFIAVDRKLIEKRFLLEQTTLKKYKVSYHYVHDPDFYIEPYAYIDAVYPLQEKKVERCVDKRKKLGFPRDRPRLQKSSLSRTEDVTDVGDRKDGDCEVKKVEKMDEVRAEEEDIHKDIGYMYFLGVDWRERFWEDVMKTNLWLVYRKGNPQTVDEEDESY